MATGKLGNSKIETQRSREARRQGSREVGKQQSKDAGKKGSRVSDKHGNREAGKHGVGKEGCRLARNYGNREAVKQGKEAGTQGSIGRMNLWTFVPTDIPFTSLFTIDPERWI